MEERKIVTVNNLDELWNGLLPDFSTGIGLHDFHVTIKSPTHSVDLDIMSSPGGSVEGGYESTSIHAALPAHPGFEFVIHPEDFLNRIGKLFGMEDVVLGYPEFDKNAIVKTNNPEKLKALFSDADDRQVFQSLSGYSFKLDNHEDSEDHYLDLSIQRAIKDLNELERLLRIFFNVLGSL